jgi:hypothetical protein
MSDQPVNRKSALNKESLAAFDESSHVMVLEKTIAVEQKKILRQKLKACILQNFENANEKCYDLRVQYVELLKDRYGGLLFPPGYEPKNRVNPSLIEKGK